MSTAIITILVFLTLVYTFYMGFNDGANAVATTITTRAMSQKSAIYVAAISKFLTPLILYFIVDSLAVADTMRGLIKSNILVDTSIKSSQIFLLAGLLSTLIWCFYTYYKKLPNSGSHTLIGGIVGAAIAAFGFEYIIWETILIKVILLAFLAPIIGLITGFLFMRGFRGISKTAPIAISRILKRLQKVNVVILSSSFSFNNVQKSLGVILLILAVAGKDTLLSTNNDIFYILMLNASMLAFGMLFGGYRIINTVGNKIYKLKPVHSVTAQIATETIVYISSIFGIPVSTGQIVSSSIMGVGAAERTKSVRWITAKKIFISWIITFPVTATMGAGLYYLLYYIQGVL